MKKICSVVLILIFAICMNVQGVSAATLTSVSEVVLEKTQTDFEIVFIVNQQKAYAGVEFALQCPDGVTVKSVKYSSAKSQAGPTVAHGFVWFTYFSGKNDYLGEVTATVSLNYAGEKNTSVVLDHISIHTVDGTKVNSEEQTLRKIILINRKGASNEVATITPPPSSNSQKTNSNKKAESGTTDKKSDKKSNKKETIKNNVSNNDEEGSERSESNEIENTRTNSNDTGETVSDNSLDETNEDDSSSKENSDNANNDTTVSEDVNDLDTFMVTPTIQTNAQKPDYSEETNLCAWPHMVMLILLVLSLLGNLCLGYLIIKKKDRENEKENQKKI